MYMDFSLSYTTPKAILIKRESASPGCNAIHSGDASARGPDLAAAYMTKVQLTNDRMRGWMTLSCATRF